MQWLFMVVVLALLVYAYRGRRDTVPAPDDARTDGSRIDGVDFYWRPG